MKEETLIWKGNPSQVVNFFTYVFCILFFWLVLPLLYMFWRWLVTKNTTYELTSQRLKTRSGVLNKKMDELELYRVRDYQMDRPLFLRLFGLGNITLQTSDKSSPIVVIRAIQGSEELREKIRNSVEECRVAKRVRDIDVDF